MGYVCTALAKIGQRVAVEAANEGTAAEFITWPAAAR